MNIDQFCYFSDSVSPGPWHSGNELSPISQKIPVVSSEGRVILHMATTPDCSPGFDNSRADAFNKQSVINGKFVSISRQALPNAISVIDVCRSALSNLKTTIDGLSETSKYWTTEAGQALEAIELFYTDIEKNNRNQKEKL